VSSQSENIDARSPRGVVASLVWIVPVLFIAALFIATTVSASAAEQLLLGWLYFPIRVSSQVTIDWPTAVLGCICMIAFVAMLHRVLVWFVKSYSQLRSDSTATHSVPKDVENSQAEQQSIQKPNGRTPPPPVPQWTMRSTIAVSSVVILLFSAGTAMVGLTHQTIWLFTHDSQKSQSPQSPVVGLIHTARTPASRSQDRNNQKSIGLSIWNHSDVFHGLPPGGVMLPDGTLMHGWAVYLGPMHGFSNGNVTFSEPWNSPENAPLFKGAIHGFLHPGIPEVFDDEGFALSHIAVNSNTFPIVMYDRVDVRRAAGSNKNSLRSLGNTILAGTVSSDFLPWGHPANIRDPSIGVNQSPDGFGGPSGDGANFVMGDGSVRFISKNTDLAVMRQLAHPDATD